MKRLLKWWTYSLLNMKMTNLKLSFLTNQSKLSLMNVGSLIGLVLLPLSLGNCAYFAPITMPQSYDISQRIKARCGIHDSVKWSNHTRLIYGKQIEAEILTINKNYK